MVVEQVEINGLLWDTENLNENGQKLYSWVEAKIYADKMGKRIPKIDEVKALFSSGFEFDYKNNGVWVFGKRLFFPCHGIYSPKDTIRHSNGAYIISDTKEYGRHVTALYVDDGKYNDISGYDDCVYMSVRLVQDLIWYRKVINYIKSLFC